MSGPTTIRIPLGIEPVSPRNCALERNFVPSLRNPAFAFRLAPRWLTWVDAPRSPPADLRASKSNLGISLSPLRPFCSFAAKHPRPGTTGGVPVRVEKEMAHSSGW